MRYILPLLSLAALAAPAPARACGGCFQPPDAVSTVTDHRMVVAISDQQTTLWDQIQYTGKPGDFVWVLPTPLPATVELAHEQFFDALEHETAPYVYGPKRGGGGGGCTFLPAGASAEDSTPGESVTVYHQGEVGPYETATIGSGDPQALTLWLTDRGYAVPPSLQPTIDWYVARSWVFSALRLKPDQSTSQMRPVRVVFPGLASVFPLRMVAAGAGPELGVLLWVIADQRYQAANYDTVEVDESKLVWSTASNRSNYRELFAETLAQHPKGAFITEYAGVLSPSAIPMVALDDLETAQVGQRTLYLTRLRTDIAPSLLAQDLTLTPAERSVALSNYHYLTSAQQQSAPLAMVFGGQRSPMLAGMVSLLLAWYLLRRRS